MRIFGILSNLNPNGLRRQAHRWFATMLISLILGGVVWREAGSTHAQTDRPDARPYYLVVGAEAAPILRALQPAGAPTLYTVMVAQPGGVGRLLAQRLPTALIVPESWSDQTDQQAARAARIPIITVQRHTTVHAMLDNLTVLGRLVGREPAALALRDQIVAGQRAVQASVRGLPLTQVLVLTPEGYTQGQGTLLTELIALAGGVNVAAAAGIPEARQISDQQLQAWNPEVILLIGFDQRQRAAFLAFAPNQQVSAVQRGRIFDLSAAMPALGKDPAQLVTQLRWLANRLHPRYF